MIGSSIIFVNDKNEILLVLRDDKESILYPGMWNLFGGSAEINETPEEAIIREVKEELGLGLDNFKFYKVTKFPDKTEYTYWRRINMAEEGLNKSLTEGQRVRWFNKEEVGNMELAFNFNSLVEEFFNKLERGLL